jgi:hypothetical protein
LSLFLAAAAAGEEGNGGSHLGVVGQRLVEHHAEVFRREPQRIGLSLKGYTVVRRLGNS